MLASARRKAGFVPPLGAFTKMSKSSFQGQRRRFTSGPLPRQPLPRGAVDMPRVLFFGGDQFSVAVLDAFLQHMETRFAALVALHRREGAPVGDKAPTIALGLPPPPPPAVGGPLPTVDHCAHLSPFIEVVCPTAPPIAELQGTAAKSHPQRHFPMPRWCAQHGLRCHVVDHPRSIAKSSLDVAALAGGKPAAPDVHSIASLDTIADGAFLEQLTDHANDGSAPAAGPSSRHRPRAFDVALVVSFRYFFSDALLSALPPVINVHPSLLPKYRGASPLFAALLRGDDEGGASVIRLGPGELMDSGDVIAQARTPLPQTTDARTYIPAVVKLSAQMLADTLLPQDSTGQPLPWEAHFASRLAAAAPQPDKVHFTQDPHYAPRIPHRRSSPVAWEQSTAAAVFNAWRAFVGGQFFGPISSLIDKGATPVGAELLNRAVSKYARKHNLRREATLEDVPESARGGLVLIHAVFGEAVSRLTLSVETRRFLATIASSAVVPGAVCFPSSAPHVAAVMCMDGEWFLWRDLTLHGSKGPVAADTFRKSFAMKCDVVYPHVFRSEAPASTPSGPVAL